MKKKGVCKVPVVIQLEAVECGAACLTMIASYYGKWLSLEQVRQDCGVSRDGVRAVNILRTARSYGFDANGFSYSDIDSLKKNCEFPCIIFWELNHFVVLDGFTRNHAVINDPARGRVKISMREFERSFSGVCIILTPKEGFRPEGSQKSIFSFVKKRLKGTAAAVIFMALVSVVLSLIDAINPLMLKALIDRVLASHTVDSAFNTQFYILLIIIGMIQLTAILIQTTVSIKISAKWFVTGNAMYIWKLLRLPMEFFSQRFPGDIKIRQASMAYIVETLINTLSPLMINTAMTIFYIFVMLEYSVILTAIGLFSLALNGLAAFMITKERTNIIRIYIAEVGKLYSTTISGIQMIETIKASGAENGYFQRWAGYQASSNKLMQRINNIIAKFGIIPNFVLLASNALVMAAGVFLSMRGNFTLGMLMTFQGLMTTFMSPAGMIIGAGQTIQEMRSDMERIDDVMEYPDDENCRISVNSEKTEEHKTEYSKLSGKIELKNVTFGYSRLEEPLIRDFSMSINPGESIAFVGATGSGKSTVSKLISGLYTQWDGEILFDGRKISEIDRNVFTGSVAIVDQEITIFEGTIAENIKLWDKSIENFEMILAAHDAQIHNDIMEREGGYSYKLIDGGRDLSGGQRQRLEIARTLAQDPAILILDEATSALDAKTEFDVIKAIRNRGITTIMIAHRLSTIRDCDEIIVISNGSIAERGKHDELMAMNGLYASLVTSE